MSARFLSVCLILAALLAANSAQLGAKPPDLPVQAVVFEDSTPEPVPIPVTPRCTTPTSKTTAAPVKMVTKVYPVADLVIPVGGDKKGPVKTTEDQLIKLISTTVAPESWAAKGGEGTLDYFPLNLALAVNQPAEIQEQIGEFLAALRKLQDVEVAVEVRFLSVSEAMFNDLFSGRDKQTSKSEPTACCVITYNEKSGCAIGTCMKSINQRYDVLGKDVTFLSDVQLRHLMEAVQADMLTNVMQAPKITMFNGQLSEMAIEEQRVFVTGLDVSRKDDQLVFQPKAETFITGLKMALQPVVSADKRFVRLSVNATETSLDSEKVPLIPVSTSLLPKGGDGAKPVPFTQFIQNPKFTTLTVDKTFTLPDGGTALINVGKRTREVDGGFRPPVLADLPYLGRLFADTGVHKETECVLMLVTPRIIVEGETEQPKKTTAYAPKQPSATPAQGGSYAQEEPPCLKKKTKDCCAGDAPCCKTKECCAAGVPCCKTKECCPCCASCCEAKDCCVPGAPCCEAATARAACASCTEPKVAELLKKYYKACADGRRAEATELAVQALALDPMCFGKEGHSKGR
jgi:hypothetical protein